jgi:hypothetical protein
MIARTVSFIALRPVDASPSSGTLGPQSGPERTLIKRDAVRSATSAVTCRHLSRADAQGIIEGGEGAVAIEEAVAHVIRVHVSPDDLALVVDRLCKGAERARRGIIEGGVDVVCRSEEAVEYVTGEVPPNNFPRSVDVKI